jgi:S-adenosylmethionine synthetase
MKRYSEAVLNGHPDKFCDIIADRIIQKAYQADPGAYGQVEVSVWSDQIFLTGGIAVSQPFDPDIMDIVVKAGQEIGYTEENHIDVTRYTINDHICRVSEDPRLWTGHVNDQSVIIGYAGYDEMTGYLPPEHFAVMFIREQVVRSLTMGKLADHGPDGKLLLIMQETGEEWLIDTLLLTLQQKENFSFTEFMILCNEVLRDACEKLQKHDSRWKSAWKAIRVLVNPNGPLLNGGSDGDNGQTGRKLVMDFYGPRIPLGGGAIYGKDLSHIDRIAAFAARKFAVDLTSIGGGEVFVRLCYAPGIFVPMDISIMSSVRPHEDPYSHFDFREMRKKMDIRYLDYDLFRLGTFYNPDLGFNVPDDEKNQGNSVNKGIELRTPIRFATGRPW